MKQFGLFIFLLFWIPGGTFVVLKACGIPTAIVAVIAILSFVGLLSLGIAILKDYIKRTREQENHDYIMDTIDPSWGD